MMLLTIIAPPVMEEGLIDWLLIHETITGFTSHASNGHGRGHDMTVSEQVTGRRRQITFLIALKKQEADVIIAELKQSFSGSDLHYWLMPISEVGHI